ncbi:MBL fold metallo-hydrolase [Streptomyces radicis]|uniref:MBL fold metallo-hydrolase n=1 Tax=Streptomyces radicis TaxID=1750517 RepID=A0A3A9VTF4_9ACTN|nr:MBL fold metallo-hydrolase [Streptomyces radicis]RKN03822.1 MBL fold metallo-hydrolase [Streptomyces radicis]RKN13939.1 MBL fold metallo-hydrolase [Streptomyces radicis]
MTLPAHRAHVRVGSTIVTYLPDGHGIHPAAATFPDADWTAYPDQLDDEGRLTLSFGAFLLEAGERRILVDLGVGAVDVELPGGGGAVGGALLKNLAEVGLSADDIDTVVFTHLHLDHVGWTTDVPPHPVDPAERAPAGLTFRNARHRVAEAEWAYWTRTGGWGAPDRRVVLEPLSGVVEFLRDGETIAPGITVHATPGHTPGHLAVAVADPDRPEAERVLIVGDILHSAVQVAEPDWSFATDVDPGRALAVRRDVLATPDAVLAAGHVTGHVFGRVERTASGTVWAPVFDGGGA